MLCLHYSAARTGCGDEHFCVNFALHSSFVLHCVLRKGIEDNVHFWQHSATSTDSKSFQAEKAFLEVSTYFMLMSREAFAVRERARMLIRRR